MPYALRGSVLSMTGRVLNLVENLTRSQKSIVIFQDFCLSRDFYFGAMEKRDQGGTEHLPCQGVKIRDSCMEGWRERDFSPVLPSPLPSWSGPSLPSLAVHEPPVEGNTQIVFDRKRQTSSISLGLGPLGHQKLH